MSASDREKAKILQEEAFLANVCKGAKQRIFNKWLAANTVEEREKLHGIAKAVEEASGFISAEANEYRRGKQ